MGIMEPQINGSKAEQAIAKEISKPWYFKVESWLSIANIIALVVNIILLLYT